MVPPVLLYSLSFIVPPANPDLILRLFLTQKPLADFQTLVLSKEMSHHSATTSSFRFYPDSGQAVEFGGEKINEI